MIGNVQILKNNGESLVSNGLAHFKFNDTNKQYVIYTLGEQINELLKIYIGYENAPVTDPGILDADSANITELLKKIGKNEDISSIVTILPLSAGLYHIHDKVKKVALQTSAFNNIISAQQRGQIQTLDKDEPIMKETTFFDSSVMKEDKVQEEPVQEQSIFSNPMQPVIDTSNQQTVSVQEEVKETPQEVAQETVQSQIVETKVEKPTNVTTINSNDQNTTNIIETDSMEGEKLISDQVAKDAILAVETAQATIRENIVIIKEFIKQQQNKVSSKTIETTVDTNNTPKEEISEIPTMTSQAESLPAQYDVVNNLELAPQPEASANVLSGESDLTGNYLIDSSINQVSAGIDTMSVVDSKSGIPEADLMQQVSTTRQAEVSQPNVETITQTQINEQQLPVDVTLSNESQSDTIDTMAMIPQQAGLNTNIDTVVTNENQKIEVLDSANMATSDSNSFAQSNTIDNPMPLHMEGTLPTMESQNTIEFVKEPIDQNSLEVQVAQNPTIDIQIPGSVLESQTLDTNSVQGVQENIPSNASIPNIPVDSTNTLNNTQEQVNSSPVSVDEFAIPQIDMNVLMTEQPQAPVVMPDGQSQDINQGLVLTPEAFNKAA